MKKVSHWIIFLSVLVLDQWTKYLAYTTLVMGNSIEILPERLNLTLVNNPGAAFGMFADFPHSERRIALLIVSFVAIWIVIRFLRHDAKDDRWAQAALIAILSGAIGNIIDRIRFDYVVDFIDVILWSGQRWPAFNIADSAISIGVALLMVRMIFYNKHSVDRKIVESAGVDQKVAHSQA